MTYTNTDRTAAHAMVDRVNEAFATGATVKVNGRTVKSWSSTPAQVWANGSVSVDVETKQGRAGGTQWAKVGQSMTVETV